MEREAGVAVDQEAKSMAIVHVGLSAPPRGCDSVHHLEALMAANPRVRRCGDVYRALALLLQRRANGKGFAQEVRAVVVCVDGVHDTEMEFFRLLRAARPAVRLLPYSAWGNDDGVARALSAGAHGPATEPEVRKLLTVPEAPPAPTAEPGSTAPPSHQDTAPAPKPLEDYSPSGGRGSFPQEPVAAVDHVLEVNAAALLEDASDSGTVFHAFRDDSETHGQTSLPMPPAGDDENPAEYAEAPEIEESAVPPEEGTAAPRVPWLRYNDQPVRMGPGARTAPQAPVRSAAENGAAPGEAPPVKPPASPGAARPGGYAPLLSDEELRALLEDDVSALTPRDDQRAQGR